MMQRARFDFPGKFLNTKFGRNVSSIRSTGDEELLIRSDPECPGFALGIYREVREREGLRSIESISFIRYFSRVFCRNKMNNIVRIQPMQYIHLLDLVGTFISKFSFWVGCSITWSELCKSILLIVDRSFRRGSSWFDVLFCKIISTSRFEACCSVYWPGFCLESCAFVLRSCDFFSWAIGVVRVCPENKYGRSGLRIIIVQKLNVKFYQQYFPRILESFVPVWRMKGHEMCSIRKVKGTYILTSIELNVRAKSVSCQLGIV